MKPEKPRRCFFAIDFTPSEQQMLQARVQPFKPSLSQLPVRWVEPEKLHLTLRFIADLSPQIIEILIPAVKQIVGKIGPFNITLDHVRLFPTNLHPHVLVIRVPLNSHLKKLNYLLNKTLLQCGIPPENRRFKPHITVAKLPHPWVTPTNLWGTQAAALDYRVNRFVLYESCDRGGAITYNVLSEFVL